MIYAMASSHLDQARPATRSINRTDDCPHDQTPLLSSTDTMTGDSFRPASSHRQNGFVGKENCFVPAGARKDLRDLVDICTKQRSAVFSKSSLE
jgi:hypothetical protein